MAVEPAPRKRLLEQPTNEHDRFHHIDTDSTTVNPPRHRDSPDKSRLDYIIRSGIAGGFAGCAAKTVVGPLDRVKILFQSNHPQYQKYTGSWFGLFRAMGDINTQAGLRGLFRGHSATLLRVFPYAGIKFLAYEQFRGAFIPSKQYETPGRRFLAGAASGVTSVFFTYPLEVIRVRLAFETKRDSRSSLSRICKQIYNERPAPPPATGAATATIQKANPRSGLVNFYRGFTPTIVGMFPYAGVSFLTHDTVGDMLRHPSIAQYTVVPESASTDKTSKGQGRRRPLTAPAELTSGAVAGLISQTASYPFEVLRRRIQVGGAVGDGHRLRMGETARTIFREHGWRGFWVGLTIGYIKVVPMSATSFFVYERMKYWMEI